MESFRPHIIIHLASALRGDHRECLLRTNIQGTRVLVDSLLRSKDCYCLPVAVLGSSGSVYGPVSAAQLPITEYNHCAPVEGYGKSKLAAEQLAQLLVTEREIRLPIARIFNVVGPGQDSRHVAGRMAAQFTSLRAGRQQSIQLGNLDATRDFIDVSDVARALVLLALDQSASGPFNVASGTELSVLDLLNHFRSLTLSSPQIEPAEEIRNDVRRHYADISRLKAIGFECRRSIEQSVESLLSYYQEIRAGDPASETAMSSPLSPGP
jgi:GDP-4-dehydro-6-deoxy-D-mannose reductase